MTDYTPILNLPYPEASDAPRGWEQIQALAEALDGQTTITPVAMPVGTGIQGGFYYVAWGRVWLYGQITRDDATAMGNGATLATLPAELRPDVWSSFAVSVISASYAPMTGRLDVSNTTGRITVNMGTGNTAKGIELDAVSWPLTGSIPKAFAAPFSAPAEDD